QQYIQVDTTNILFICGGTFVGLEDIIAGRLGKRSIGFGGRTEEARPGEDDNLLNHLTSEDLVEFGLIPEFVGRLPIITSLRPLDVDALMRVLSEPKDALVRQYQELFAMENAELEFTEEALRLIARKAYEKGTGARGLRSIVENFMLDILFELPEQPPGSRYVVTPEVVEGKQPLFPLPAAKNKSA
ncbi:MAG: ATP-dependent Clp protease ATP-binding subunit ClpX, partial [Planctomycetota bacterium]